MTVQEDNATREIVVPEVTVTGHQQETRETTVMKEAAGEQVVSCRVKKENWTSQLSRSRKRRTELKQVAGKRGSVERLNSR
ncbi:hypothetical protein PABG_11515 [Paracoccidioides brasiliensis Pb03]|nr:hypothetical protein PABG_11515 [Paracoccidioides brasiliensis Pb03]